MHFTLDPIKIQIILIFKHGLHRTDKLKDNAIITRATIRRM